ncbi:MAG: type II secretion system protein [Patescibacteria group bacterium]
MFLHTCKKKGFTLVELLVTTSIFVFITALLLTKYGNFNQSVLLTNLAYDIALTIRTAQTYGLSVQKSTGSATQFKYAYGVHFDGNNQSFIFFTDSDPDNGNKIYTNNDVKISTYNIKRGAKILGFCTSDSCGNAPENIDSVDISFLRPNPDAQICVDGTCGQSYLKIIVQAIDDSTRNIVIRRTGQVSVE